MKHQSRFNRWVYKLKNLPATKRGTASGLCTFGCLYVVFMGFFILQLFGIKFKKEWMIVGAIIAQGMSTLIFFAWSRIAVKQ